LDFPAWAAHHRIGEPESDCGFDRLIALLGGDPTKDEMRQAAANVVTDGYIHDPVRLPAGALQCHWHLELTPHVGVLRARLPPVDIVFLEGFRLTYHPKLEMVQPQRNRRVIALDDPLVLAVPAARPVDASVPFLPLCDVNAFADFVLMRAQ
jgi:hypothetical protein